jgi:hypothetical protein
MAFRTPAICAAAIAALLLSSCGGGGGGKDTGDTSTAAAPAATTSSAPAALPGAQTGPAPWNAGGAELGPRLDALGLPALPAEGTVLHIHQHLDMFVNGKRVTVPAGIGIDPNQEFISPLHTHDPSGVLHVESPTQKTFTLGQFFGVWGVPLDSTRLGGLKAGAGKELRAWVNGKPASGDPGAIELASHQELVVAYGTPAQMPKSVPSTYGFPPGE